MSLIVDRINRVLSKNKWSESDIYNVMTNFRQLLEQNNLKEKYQILNLYCNWTLHTSIKQSLSAYRMLERITDALIKYGIGEYEEGHFSDIVIESIALHQLNEEIISLGEEYQITSCSKLQDLNVAHEFIGKLILVLLGKPLIIDHNILSKNKKLRDITENMYNKSLNQTGHPDNYIVLGFSFVISENKIHWKIMTKYSIKNEINMIGKLILVDRKEIERVKSMRIENGKPVKEQFPIIENKMSRILYHYTSFNAFNSIIESCKLRFTNIRYLNDKSEYLYALDLLKSKVLEFERENNISKGIDLSMFDQFFFSNKLYSVSFCENGNDLNLWRGYCPSGGGISIGFNKDTIFTFGKIAINKCIYGDPYPPMEKPRYDWFKYLFDNVMLIHKNREFIQMTYQTAHIKHEGFIGEQEWRGISFAPKQEQISYFNRGQIEVPFFDVGFFKSSIQNVYVGPSESQDEIFQKVRNVLLSNGINCSIEKSKIPFRQF